LSFTCPVQKTVIVIKIVRSFEDSAIIKLPPTSGALGRLGNRIPPAWPWPYLLY
jgi:hypothetical protein